MRGYKGKLEKSSGIINSGKLMTPDPVDYGDEALLFARRLNNATVVVGRNRSENLGFYFPKVEPDVMMVISTLKLNVKLISSCLMLQCQCCATEWHP